MELIYKHRLANPVLKSRAGVKTVESDLEAYTKARLHMREVEAEVRASQPQVKRGCRSCS